MPNAVIIDAVRTPIGRRNGVFKDIHPVDLAAIPLQALVERNQLDPSQIDDVIMGTVSQTGEQAYNVGRNAALAAGFPEEVPGVTIDRQCGSSQQAAHFAAQAVMAGAQDIVIAAGVESMTRVPMGATAHQGPGLPFGPRMLERYSQGLVPQGISAEMIAEKWGLSRADLDQIALESHLRANRATEEGRFEEQIIPVGITRENGTRETITHDEGIRPDTSLEKLAGLQPAFKGDGVITAGNSSQISDGAAAVLVMSEDRAAQLELAPKGAFRRVRHGRCRPDHDAHRAHPGYREGAGTGQSHHWGYRPLRGERSIRLGRGRLAGGAWRIGPDRLVGADQCKRGGNRPWTSARCLWRPCAHDDAVGVGADRWALRVANDV